MNFAACPSLTDNFLSPPVHRGCDVVSCKCVSVSKALQKSQVKAQDLEEEVRRAALFVPSIYCESKTEGSHDVQAAAQLGS